MTIGPATEVLALSSSGDSIGYEVISHYCNGKESHWSLLPHVDTSIPSDDDNSSRGTHLAKENNAANNFDAGVPTLPTKSQTLHSSPIGASIPDKKHVFRNKENFEGRRSIASKKRQSDESKMLRQKLIKSERRIASLQEEVDRKDDQLAERQNRICVKDEELEDLSEFVSSLQDFLREMGRDGAEHAKPALAAHPSYASGLEHLDGSAVDGHQDAKAAVQVKITSKAMQEIDVRELKAKIANLHESLASQEDLIESLKGRNMTSEQTISSLTRLIREKDQALADMSQFSEMNDRANAKMLAHANEKHREALNEFRTIHENEITSLVEKNARLSESVLAQARLLDSLKRLNLDFETTVRSMAQLICEKDEALAEISHYSASNDWANAKLLIHAKTKHAEEMRDKELHIENLRRIISSQLREKLIGQRELAVMKLQEDDLSEMSVQYFEEVNFILATLTVMTLLMALVWETEWFFYVSPVYILFLSCSTLE